MIDMTGIFSLQDRLHGRDRRGALGRVGMSPEKVRAAMAREAERIRPLTVEEIRRAAVKALRKGSVGRSGLPAYAVDAMYADYQRLNSVEKVGKLYGRTRQAVHEIFVSHGKKLRDRSFFSKRPPFTPIIYRGRKFTPGKDDYFRATTGDRALLHYLIWEDERGPVPPGCELRFINGNTADARIWNLECLSKAEMRRKNATGHNQFTKRSVSS